MKQVDLSRFTGEYFSKEANIIKISIWFVLNSLFFKSSLFQITKCKVFLLKLFGAKIGKGIVIKNNVNIKFPWKLVIGDNCWIGENVWIDNLDHVKIGNNVCLSQGALLLTGNHDYSDISFEYRNDSIILEDGVWIGAKAVVCPGVVCKSHSILAVGSVATKKLNEYEIYQGNPAVYIRKRVIK